MKRVEGAACISVTSARYGVSMASRDAYCLSQIETTVVDLPLISIDLAVTVVIFPSFETTVRDVLTALPALRYVVVSVFASTRLVASNLHRKGYPIR